MKNHPPTGPLEVAVIGGGLAGLAAARRLASSGRRVAIFESQGDVGGRVQTDRLDGFLLDHGFQVYLTAYPTAAAELDLARLRLGLFDSGALVRIDGRFRRVSDAARDPLRAVETALAPIGSVGDKLRVALLRRYVMADPPEALLGRHRGESTEAYLKGRGFSPKIIDRFFRPFFGGIFLDDSLETSANVFLYLFRMFAAGHAALPEGGMQAIPRQIAEGLPPGAVHLGRTAVAAERRFVRFDDGSSVAAERVIVAAEANAAARLIGADGELPFCGTACLYYAADRPPTDEPILMLRGDRGDLAGEGDSPAVNSVAVLSNAQPSYAPPGRHLISVSVLGETQRPLESLRDAVQTQLTDWFGTAAASWSFLRAYRVPWGLPDQAPRPRPAWVDSPHEVILAGDYFGPASIESAIASGLAAARKA